mmetsp:Transcript_15005/g.36291  ORF Transcript_15005/g.36291 Transcript_15005/m.36291 type:complete len:233 (-) Transcript_15005:398-1096(-)
MLGAIHPLKPRGHDDSYHLRGWLLELEEEELILERGHADEGLRRCGLLDVEERRCDLLRVAAVDMEPKHEIYILPLELVPLGPNGGGTLAILGLGPGVSGALPHLHSPCRAIVVEQIPECHRHVSGCEPSQRCRLALDHRVIPKVRETQIGTRRPRIQELVRLSHSALAAQTVLLYIAVHRLHVGLVLGSHALPAASSALLMASSCWRLSASRASLFSLSSSSPRRFSSLPR